MFEEQVYRDTVESLTAWAVRQNEYHRNKRLGAVTDWLRNADVNRANGQPLPPQPAPPAQVVKIVSIPGASDQQTIQIVFGPELVAEPGPVILPPIKSQLFADFPPGVFAPGYDYGEVMAGLPQDTIPNGEIKEHNGKKWEKVEGFGLFGRMNFYRLVK